MHICTCTNVGMYRSEDNFWLLILCIHHVKSEDRAQVLSLVVGKCFTPEPSCQPPPLFLLKCIPSFYIASSLNK